MTNAILHKRLMHTLSRKKWDSNHVAAETPPPPNVIPESSRSEFTLDAEIPVLCLYFDERAEGNSLAHNTPEKYKNIFLELDDRFFSYYGSGGQAFFDAACAYSMEEKSVTIWGLAGCNCEAFAVWANAANVFVVDYSKPICENEKIVVYNHDEFNEHEVKTEFAISYSSFEHDGLGRYGDPLTPNGDLHAMRQAWNSLTDGGILFWGLPLGQDCLVWNAHRIYGKLRLPMMLRGWQLLDVFSVHEAKTPEYPFEMPLGEYRIQCLMVLKKMVTDWPDDDYLLQSKKTVSGSTNSAAIFNMISRMVYRYKHAVLEGNHAG